MARPTKGRSPLFKYFDSSTAQALDHLWDFAPGAIAPVPISNLHGEVLLKLPRGGLRQFWQCEIKEVRVEFDRCLLLAKTASAARIVSLRREQLESAVELVLGSRFELEVVYG